MICLFLYCLFEELSDFIDLVGRRGANKIIFGVVVDKLGDAVETLFEAFLLLLEFISKRGFLCLVILNLLMKRDFKGLPALKKLIVAFL